MASLERRLGLFSVVTISISSMIGSGIFVLPGIGFDITGSSLYLAFILSAICILPAAMSKAELATAMPTSGGTYVYLERTFGPLVGTVSGLGLFLSILLKAAFSLVGIKAYFSILSAFDPTYTALSFLTAIVAINLLGVGKVSSFLTIILFITMVGLGFLCLFAIPDWSWENAMPDLSHGMAGLASATALVFVSFAGVTKIAAIAEEVKNPERNLPKGILLSLFLVTIIYCSVSLILAGVYENSEIAGELRPIYKLAFDIGGPTIGGIFAAIATLTMVNTSNAGILAGSRFPFAMSRDHLLPKMIGKLHPRFLTPIMSILLSGIIVAIILVALDVTKIAKLASAFMIMMYIMVNLAVIVLRETRTQWYRPKYKSPLYPILQIFGILSGSILLMAMGELALFAILSIAIPGILLYLGYSKRRTTRKGVIAIRGKRNDLIQTYPSEAGSFCTFDIKGDAQVVVGLFGQERSPEMLIEMGIAITEHTNIEVARIIELPEQTDLHDFVEEPAEMKSLKRRIKAMAEEKKESIKFDQVPSHDISQSVYEISQGVHCKWLLIEWSGKTRASFTFHSPLGWLKSHLLCNLVTFRDSGVRYIRKIMVYINSDHNDKLILETADHLAQVFKADITLVSYMDEKFSQQKKDYESEFLEKLGKDIKAPVKARVISGHDKLSSITYETINYDLLIHGSAKHTLFNSFFGTFEDKITAKASCSVLSVHSAINKD